MKPEYTGATSLAYRPNGSFSRGHHQAQSTLRTLPPPAPRRTIPLAVNEVFDELQRSLARGEAAVLATVAATVARTTASPRARERCSSSNTSFTARVMVRRGAGGVKAGYLRNGRGCQAGREPSAISVRPVPSMPSTKDAVEKRWRPQEPERNAPVKVRKPACWLDAL